MIGWLKFIFGIGISAAFAPPNVSWPDLPATGFVTGRAATTADIAAGNAIFSIQPAGRGPLEIPIPQYAFWTDEQGRRIPVIIVQAEYGPNGEEIIGMRALDGSEMAATMPEVTLLGTAHPR